MFKKSRIRKNRSKSFQYRNHFQRTRRISKMKSQFSRRNSEGFGSMATELSRANISAQLDLIQQYSVDSVTSTALESPGNQNFEGFQEELSLEQSLFSPHKQSNFQKCQCSDMQLKMDFLETEIQKLKEIMSKSLKG